MSDDDTIILTQEEKEKALKNMPETKQQETDKSEDEDEESGNWRLTKDFR